MAWFLLVQQELKNASIFTYKKIFWPLRFHFRLNRSSPHYKSIEKNIKNQKLYIIFFFHSILHSFITHAYYLRWKTVVPNHFSEFKSRVSYYSLPRNLFSFFHSKVTVVLAKTLGSNISVEDRSCQWHSFWNSSNAQRHL